MLDALVSGTAPVHGLMRRGKFEFHARTSALFKGSLEKLAGNDSPPVLKRS
jgi:hypothetical protein